jgi:hypothetical protein
MDGGGGMVGMGGMDGLYGSGSGGDAYGNRGRFLFYGNMSRFSKSEDLTIRVWVGAWEERGMGQVCSV